MPRNADRMHVLADGGYEGEQKINIIGDICITSS